MSSPSLLFAYGSTKRAFGEMKQTTKVCRCILVALLEEFYKVRYVGKAALGTHLRYGEVCRREHNLGSVESLSDNPVVGRRVEESLKLLLEGGKRTISQRRQSVYRYIVENVFVDGVYEVACGDIGRPQKLLSYAIILADHYQID